MYFTQEDYRKIEAYLKSKAARDTSFDSATTPLQGNETIVLVQGGKNVNTTVSDIVSQFFALGVSDFINVTDKYGISYNTLDEAIRVIPWRSRKVGQVITFLNEQGEWHLYQYQGESILTWNNTTLWVDLLESRIVNSILPDQEDLTMTEPDADGNSYTHFKDKDYSIDDFSGLGRVYLRKNLQTLTDPNTGETRLINYLTQTMVGKENVIYHIQYDYNLNGQTIIIPEGCVLLFEGGSIANGTITGQDTKILGSTLNIFTSIVIEGTWNVPTISTSMFSSLSEDNDLRKVIALSNSRIQNTIIIEDGIYNIDIETNQGTGITLNSNTHLILNGNIQLKSNNFTNYSIINIVNCSNVIVSGSGSIIGDRETHIDTGGEWGIGINILDSVNVEITGIDVSNCWGDSIYIGNPSTSRININKCHLSKSRRQGISITEGDTIVVDSCTITDIIGTDPQSAIDIEPNANGNITNVIVKNVKVSACHIGIMAYARAAGAIINNISFYNCYVNGVTFAGYRMIGEGINLGSIENCISVNSGGYPIEIRYMNDFKISNCILQSAEEDVTGIFQSACQVGTITGCNITAPKGIGVGSNMVITNNKITATDSILNYSDFGNVTNVTFNNNNCIGPFVAKYSNSRIFNNTITGDVTLTTIGTDIIGNTISGILVSTSTISKGKIEKNSVTGKFSCITNNCVVTKNNFIGGFSGTHTSTIIKENIITNTSFLVIEKCTIQDNDISCDILPANILCQLSGPNNATGGNLISNNRYTYTGTTEAHACVSLYISNSQIFHNIVDGNNKMGYGIRLQEVAVNNQLTDNTIIGTYSSYPMSPSSANLVMDATFYVANTGTINRDGTLTSKVVIV